MYINHCFDVHLTDFNSNLNAKIASVGALFTLMQNLTNKGGNDIPSLKPLIFSARQPADKEKVSE